MSFLAHLALQKSVDSILADGDLTDAGRAAMLEQTGEQFREHTGLSKPVAAEAVAKAIRKARGETTADYQSELDRKARLAQEAVERAAAQRQQIQAEHDPKEEEDKVPETATKASINETIHKCAAAGRRPHETEAQAYTRFVTADPSSRILFKAYLAAPADDSERPRVVTKAAEPAPGSALAEVEARAAEILKAHPALSMAQARARAYEGTPGLLKRALAESRGEPPEAA